MTDTLTSLQQFQIDMALTHDWVQGGDTANVTLGGVSTPTIRNAIRQLLSNGGVIGFQTKTLMDADLAHDANAIAFVTNDSTASNNGWYIKTGASGSGSWQKSALAPVTASSFESLLAALSADIGAKAAKPDTFTAGDIVQFAEDGDIADAGLSVADIMGPIGRVHAAGRQSPCFFLFLDPRRPQTVDVLLDAADGIVCEKTADGRDIDHSLMSSLFLDPEHPQLRTVVIDAGDRILGDDSAGRFGFFSCSGGSENAFLDSNVPGTVAAVVDGSGGVIAAVDRHGVPSFSGAVSQPTPYIADGTLRLAQGGGAFSPIPQMREWTALSAYPQNSDSVRAVLSRAGEVRTASVTLEGAVVPDADPAILHVFVVVGQSLCIGAQGQPVLTPYPPIEGLCLMFDGGEGMDIRMGLDTASSQTITALDPTALTGFQDVFSVAPAGSQRGQTLAESLGYRIAANEVKSGHGWKSLWIVSGVGGTTYAGMKRGTTPYANTLAAVARAAELAAAEGMFVQVEALIQKHGESDSGNSNYYNCLLEWQSDYEADLKEITGQTKDIPMIMSMPSSFANATYSIEAMLRAHVESPKHWLACVDYPFQYASDYLHLAAPGYHLLGETMTQAVLEVAFFGKCDCVRMTGATRAGTTVTVSVNVPVPPLVFDTSQVTQRDGNLKGFTYYSGSSQIGITAAAVTDAGEDGTATVTLTLAEAPSGNGQETVCYAWDPQTSPRTADGIPRGNLRDSAGDKRKSSYDGRRLDNWAVHQKQSVTTGG